MLLCITLKVGVYVLGVFLCLNLLGAVFNPEPVNVFATVVIDIYPVFRFLQMCYEDCEQTRYDFAFAYKMYSYISSNSNCLVN